jgi:hypothetical protein
VLRRRILDDASIPYVLIDIDSSWRLPWDRHPNARAAHAIAAAIVTELRGRLAIADPLRERKEMNEAGHQQTGGAIVENDAIEDYFARLIRGPSTS